MALTRLCPFCLVAETECTCPKKGPVVPGMREIPDPQAEVERLAAARKRGVTDAAVRALLASRFAFTPQQIDALTPDQVALLLADDDSKESE